MSKIATIAAIPIKTVRFGLLIRSEAEIEGSCTLFPLIKAAGVKHRNNIEQHPSAFGKAWRKLGTGGGCGAGACDLGDAIVKLKRVVLLGLVVGIAIGRVKRGGEERESSGYKYDVFHAIRLRVLGLIFNIHAPLGQMLSDSSGLLLPVFGGFLILASSLVCTRECVPP